MTSTAITMLVVVVCLVPLAGVFGAMDAALQRVSKARVEEMRREGVKRAGALEEVLSERARHAALLLLLRIVREILDGIDDVYFSTLTSADVVRHRLVGDIVDAYERWDAHNQAARAAAGPPVRSSRPRRQGS